MHMGYENNSRAGRFRVRGLLEQQMAGQPPSEATVGRAMAINRQFHGAPGPWTSMIEQLSFYIAGLILLLLVTAQHAA
jgi:hypothetical protein